MTTLHLTLKKKWFDMILSGEKKEEYRELKEYWVNRLVDGLDFHPHTLEQFEWRGMIVGMSSPRHYDYVIFKNGYKKDSPSFKIEVLNISVDPGKIEWGAEPGVFYFVIKLGKILETKNV